MTDLTTRVGVSIGEPDRPRHVAVVREPTTGSMLRTKGRLYVLVDVEEGTAQAREAAVEAADVLRDGYYYDLSAGIDVSLRRAIVEANKRARAKVRGWGGLHLACAVLCRNELYVAKVGAGEIFLVRRARLFVPGTSPGELTDYAYRAGRPTAPRLGADAELAVSIWREQAEPGDSLVLTVGRLVEVIGADELKTALLTLHPSAAAQQLRERFIAAPVAGRSVPGVVVVEVAPLEAAPRVRPQPAPAATVEDPEVEAIAERIRGRFEGVMRGWQGLGRALRDALQVPARPVVTALAVVLALLPRRRAALPRATEVAAVRALRRRRLTIALSIALLVASSGVLALAYADFQEARATGNAALALLRARQEIDAAQAAATSQPPDASAARERLEQAERFLAEAAGSRRADQRQIEELRTQIAQLRESLTNLLLDLAKLDPKSAPTSLDYARQEVVFLADPGAAKLWQIPTSQPAAAGVLGQAGSPEGLGAPVYVTTAGDIVYTLDVAGRLFRYEGQTRREIQVRDRRAEQPADFAIFSQNLYILDRALGQVWKYEPSADGHYSSPAIAFLAQPMSPGTARSLAVDGDVWIVNDAGQLLRYRRGSGATAGQLEFTVRWRGEPAHAVAVQAKEGQARHIWLLDASARRVVQVAKDGAEVGRIALPTELAEPTGFVVLEELGRIVSLHGARLARTDLAR